MKKNHPTLGKGRLYEVRHLIQVGRSTRVKHFSSRVYIRKIFHQSKISFISVSLHVFFQVAILFSFFFSFYFDFEAPIKINTVKFYTVNCTFSCNKYKHTPSPIYMSNPVQVRQHHKNCLHGDKSSHLCEISTCVEMRSHLGGMNSFSYKEILFGK